MNNTSIIFFAAAMFGGVSVASAQLSFHDPNNGSVTWGSPSGNGTSTISSVSGLSYGPLQVSDSAMSYNLFLTNRTSTDGAISTSNGFTSLPLVDGNSWVYFSVLVNVPDVSVFGNNGGRGVAGFTTTGDNAYSYGLGVSVSGGGAISFAADTGTGFSSLGGSLAEGTTALLVGRMSGFPTGPSFTSPGSFEYVINPDLTNPGEPLTWDGSVSTAGNSGNLTSVDTATIRMDAFTTGWNDDNNATIVFDELRIGGTWADVVPTQVIPEPSTYGLIFGGLALAGVMIRRRLRG